MDQQLFYDLFKGCADDKVDADTLPEPLFPGTSTTHTSTATKRAYDDVDADSVETQQQAPSDATLQPDDEHDSSTQTPCSEGRQPPYKKHRGGFQTKTNPLGHRQQKKPCDYCHTRNLAEHAKGHLFADCQFKKASDAVDNFALAEALSKEKHDAEIKRIQAQHEEAIAALRDEHKALVASIHDNHERATQETLAEHEETIASLQKQHRQDLLKHVDDMRKTRTEQTEIFKGLVEDRTRGKVLNEEQEKKISKLKEDIERLKSNNSSNTTMLNWAREEKNRLEVHVKNLEACLEDNDVTETEEYKEMERECREWEREYTELEEERTEQKKLLDDRTKDVERLEKEVETLKARCGNLQYREKEIKELEIEYDALEKEHRAYGDLLGGSKEEVDRLEGKVKTLGDLLAVKSKEVQRLEALESTGTGTCTCGELKTRNRLLEGKVEQLKLEVDSLYEQHWAEMKTLKASQGVANAARAEGEKYKEMKDSLERELNGKQGEIDDLRKDLEGMKRCQALDGW